MARPIKDGVDYFPLNVSTDTDKKFRIIEAKFGIVGFGIIIKLFQQIYGDNGYFYKWDEDSAIIFSALCSCQKFPVSELDVKAVVSEAINRDIFDNDLYEKYGILTSRGLQRRYFEAVKRRSRVDVKKEYLLIGAPEIPENVYINGVNVNINSENVCSNTQSKVNKSKVNKKESNNAQTREATPSPTLEEVKAFFSKECLSSNPDIFFNHYEALGWKNISDWKAKAREWSLKEKKPEKADYGAYDLDLYERMLDRKD